MTSFRIVFGSNKDFFNCNLVGVIVLLSSYIEQGNDRVETLHWCRDQLLEAFRTRPLQRINGRQGVNG